MSRPQDPTPDRPQRARDPLPAAVRAALSQPGLADPLRRIAALRRTLGPADAALAATQIELSPRAEAAFPGLSDGVFTREGLEQASHPAVSTHRARHLLRSLGAGALVLDATCGLGADAAALATAGLRAVLADVSLERARLAAWNTRNHPGCLGTIVADAARPALCDAQAVLIDPDRRPGGRRTTDPSEWSPSLAAAIEIAGRHRAGCLKLAPSLDAERIALPPQDVLESSWQWLSYAGELKECVLWTGVAAMGRGKAHEAVALGRDGSASSLSNLDADDRSGERDAPALDAESAARVAWITEPDPAVLRAGLVGLLARKLGAQPLGPGIAYLGTAAEPSTPGLSVAAAGGCREASIARSWRVVASEALDRRRVRRLLSQHDIGPLTVKKRGHPKSAEQLARELRGPGRKPGLLLVTRLERGHRVYLLELPPTH